jgi:hypothetical protein
MEENSIDRISRRKACFLAVATAMIVAIGGCTSGGSAVADDGYHDAEGQAGTAADGFSHPAVRVMGQLIEVETWGLEKECQCDPYYGEAGISPEDCSAYYVGNRQQRREYLTCLEAHIASADTVGPRVRRALNCTADGIGEMLSCFDETEAGGVDICGAQSAEVLDECETQAELSMARCAGVPSMDEVGPEFEEGMSWMDEVVYDAARAGGCQLGPAW